MMSDAALYRARAQGRPWRRIGSTRPVSPSPCRRIRCAPCSTLWAATKSATIQPDGSSDVFFRRRSGAGTARDGACRPALRVARQQWFWRSRRAGAVCARGRAVRRRCDRGQPDPRAVPRRASTTSAPIRRPAACSSTRSMRRKTCPMTDADGDWSTGRTRCTAKIAASARTRSPSAPPPQADERLRDHARFEALDAHFRAPQGLYRWQDWPSAYRDPRSAEVEAFAREHRRRSRLSISSCKR